MRLPDNPAAGTHSLTAGRPFRALEPNLEDSSAPRAVVIACPGPDCGTAVGIRLELDETRDGVVHATCPRGHTWAALNILAVHFRAYSRLKHGIPDGEIDQEWLLAAGFGELPTSAPRATHEPTPDIDMAEEIRKVAKFYLSFARREAKRAVRTHVKAPIKRATKKGVRSAKRGTVRAVKRAAAYPTSAVLRTAWQVQTAGSGPAPKCTACKGRGRVPLESRLHQATAAPCITCSGTGTRS